MSDIKSINAEQLKEWLETGEAVLVDVREPHEFASSHIPQAMSMPLTNIDKHLASLKGESRKIVFQCVRGKRGEMGAEVAVKALGSEAAIYNLAGGIEAWDVAGFAITRDDADSGGGLPIARQVQVAVGSLLLLFSLLSLAGVKFASVVTLLIGAGLLFAGLTGSCMLAMLLVKMPWNKK